MLRPVDEAEVVAAFLGTELDSPRFGPGIAEVLEERRLPAELISAPDLGDESQNEARAAVLEAHRGWLTRTELFEGLPREIDW